MYNFIHLKNIRMKTLITRKVVTRKISLFKIFLFFNKNYKDNDNNKQKLKDRESDKL